ncbi:unnamed protein product [Cladocopium goreaui]|uniref:Class I SAM-dependent methyltransferase n=1 Tax=Cladocopium goreaui TaxID=2562237 RepID=A0A9P1CL22_9DINO|nr:unnamed protein product [Cladocopium goreaui]
MAPWLLGLVMAQAATGYHCAANRNDTRRAKHAIRVCERRLAQRCRGQNRLVELPGCPPESVDFPPAAKSLFGGTEASELGCISRSTQLGRALWCLARHGGVRKALELFTGIGAGTTLLLGHALGRRDRPGTFFSVDRDHVNAWHATEVLHAAAKVEALVVPLSDAQGIPSGTKEGFQAPGSYILQGDVFKHPKFIEALCFMTDGMDLIMLDPATDLRHTWPKLEKWCRPKFLAIHNSNLPGHAGWIPAQLKRRAPTAQDDHAWYELMNGSHPSIWEPGMRHWSLMARCD